MLGALVRRIPTAKFLATKLKKKKTYWESRSGMNYYKEVLSLARKYAPGAKSIVDVGSFYTPFINRFGWIEEKVSLDLRLGYLEGARVIRADFYKWKPDKKYDLVICLQVLEHLEKPEIFARKLLKTGRVVIISVPYKWKRGLYHRHIQDPVDEKKIIKWVGKNWKEHLIVEDNGLKRLIAVFK